MSERELAIIDDADDCEIVRAEPRPNKKGKIILRTLEDMDYRTVAARRAKEMIATIEESLGLGDDIPIEQKLRIVDLAVLNAMTEDLATRFFEGEKIDRLLFATLVNAKRRSIESII